MMNNIDVNTVFLAVSTAMAGFSILLVWVYMFEAARGVEALTFDVCKSYVNTTFWISCVSVVFLWLSVAGINEQLFKMLVLQMAAWFATAVLALIFSLLPIVDTNSKKRMRAFITPCIGKVLFLTIVMWLLY